MSYWLFKTEPSCFSLDDLKNRPGMTEHWDGVRNYQARNFMRAMRAGDETKMMSVGIPRTGIESAVVDSDDRPLPTGEIGEVVVRGEIVELVEYGVFAPQDAGPEDWRFPEDALALARDAAVEQDPQTLSRIKVPAIEGKARHLFGIGRIACLQRLGH